MNTAVKSTTPERRRAIRPGDGGNGISTPSIGMSRLLLTGDARTRDLAATDKLHRTHIVYAGSYREWTNPHGVRFTDWEAPCGASGTVSGHPSMGTATGLISMDDAHRAMLCPACCAEVN